MRKSVPSQIVGYLESIFDGRPDRPDALAVFNQVGRLAGLIELCDLLPDELVILQEPDLSAFFGALATIRFAVDQYRNTRAGAALNPIPAALIQFYPLLQRLPDQAISQRIDLAFIDDAQIRDMVALDVSAIDTAIVSAEWKGATIISGSCCEALLLFGLQKKERLVQGSIAAAVRAIAWGAGRAPNALDLIDVGWSLFSYAQVARQCGLISEDSFNALQPARNYRNLIHPAKRIREQVSFNRGTAYVGCGALELVITELRRNLP